MSVMYYNSEVIKSKKDDCLIKLDCLKSIYNFILDSVPNNFNSFVVKQREIFYKYVDSGMKNFNSFSKASFKNKCYMRIPIYFNFLEMKNKLEEEYGILDKEFVDKLEKLIKPEMFCDDILNRIEGMCSIYVNFLNNYENDLKKYNDNNEVSVKRGK